VRDARAVPAHLRVFTRHALLTYGLKHWRGWQFRLLAGCVRMEAWVREKWAAWHGERETAELFGELRTIAGEMRRGRSRVARRRLEAIVRSRGRALLPDFSGVISWHRGLRPLTPCLLY